MQTLHTLRCKGAHYGTKRGPPFLLALPPLVSREKDYVLQTTVALELCTFNNDVVANTVSLLGSFKTPSSLFSMLNGAWLDA